MADGQTKVQAPIQSRVLARVTSAVPVLPPRLAVVELGILLVLPALLEWQWSQFPALTTYQPHPYWAVVLLLSMQYGTVSGLLAAAVAIVATAMIGLPEPDIGENHFAYLVRVWTQPVLWISAALLLGHFRIRQIEQRNALNRTVEELRKRSATLTSHSEGLAERCNALERRLAVRSKSDATALLNAFAEMPGGATNGRWPSIFDAAMQAAFPGATATLYTMGDSDVYPMARSGTHVLGTVPRLSGGDPLVVAAGQGRLLSVMSGSDDAMLSGRGLFSVPVPGTAGQSKAILLVQSMPPALVDQGTSKRLQVFALAIARVMPAAQLGEVEVATDVATQGLGNVATVAEPILAIPVVPKWRQSRWLPAALRAAEPVLEEPADSVSEVRRSITSMGR